MLAYLKQHLTSLDLYLNSSYRLVILRQTLLKHSMILKFTFHWIVLKFWAQTRKLQDMEDSKIVYCKWILKMDFNKTNHDGKLYIFRNIFFVIFSWLSVKCCIDDFTIVYITNRLFWQSQIFLSYTRNINLVRTNPRKWSPSHKNKLRFNQDKPCKLINLSIKWGNYQESLKGSKCA